MNFHFQGETGVGAVNLLREIGLSSLIAAVVATVLTNALARRREHRHWMDENRKLEWRQLIDELHDCIDRMSCAFLLVAVGDSVTDPNAGIVRGNRIIANRIFIADVIDAHSLKDRWKELVEYVVRADCPRDPSAKGAAPTMTGFQTKARAFEDELLETARKDLGL